MDFMPVQGLIIDKYSKNTKDYLSKYISWSNFVKRITRDQNRKEQLKEIPPSVFFNCKSNHNV
jgi:hypothetical protein